MPHRRLAQIHLRDAIYAQFLLWVKRVFSLNRCKDNLRASVRRGVIDLERTPGALGANAAWCGAVEVRLTWPNRSEVKR